MTGKSSAPGRSGMFGEPEAIADPALEADGGDAAAVADRRRGSATGARTSTTRPARSLEADDLDPGVEGGGPSGPWPSGVMIGPTTAWPRRPGGAPWARPGGDARRRRGRRGRRPVAGGARGRGGWPGSCGPACTRLEGCHQGQGPG